MQARKHLKNKKAFSLIEFLIVTAVLGILFVVLISKVDFATTKGKMSGLQTDFRSFQMALHAVGVEQQGYTKDIDQLIEQLNRNLDPVMKLIRSGNGMESAKTDPWGKNYLLSYSKSDDNNGRVSVLSFGPDETEDTLDDIRMIVTYQLTDTGGIIVVDADGADYCQHSYGEWITSKTADCSQEGTAYRVCSECEARQTRVINPLGHDVDENGICATCGKNFVAGLYKTGTNTAIMSWDELIANNIVTENGAAFGSSAGGVSDTIARKLSGDLILPTRLTSIPSYAFDGCSNLTSITIPSGCSTIYDYAFNDCSSLKSIVIPESVTFIGNHVFRNCTSITQISLPSNVTSIGNGLFYGCTELSDVSMSNLATTIGDSAFYNCTSLTAIKLPASLNSIGYGAFQGCSELSSIQFGAVLDSIGQLAFNGCSSLKSISLPNSVTTMGTQVFSECENLTTVILPSSLTVLPASTFSACKRLTTVTLPSNLEVIGSAAFSGCKKLSGISIPYTVKEIRLYAFNGCNALKKTNFEGTINQWCQIEIADMTASPTYYSKDLYIQGVLLESATISSVAGSIGNYAFCYCKSLKNVVVEPGVTKVGSYAFAYCTGLDSVTLSNSITELGSHVFLNCTSLGSISLGSGIMSVPDYFLSGCSSLTSITIVGDITSIGCKSFACSGLNLISYYGNIADWEAITKDLQWDNGADHYVIICLDETIEK